MKFDWTVNFGHILTLISLLIVFGAGYMNMVRRIDRIEANLDLVFRWFENNVIGRNRDERRERERKDEDKGSAANPQG